MSQSLKKAGLLLLGMIAVVVLGFGAHTVYASSTQLLCNPDQPGYVGECPPLDHGQCNDICNTLYGMGSGGCAGGCCICAVR